MVARVAVNPQVTHWCMTYFFEHQGIDEDLQREHEKQVLIEKIQGLGIIYCILGLEVCPSSGKLHLQIAFITTDRYRWEQMQKKFAPVHIEAMRKAAWRSRRYCKKDGKFTEIGTLPSGYTDEEPSANQCAAAIIQLCREGKEDEIIERFPAQYMRQYNTIQKLLMEFEVWHPIGRKVCIWLVSKDFYRTGKSTFLAKHFPARRGEVYWHPQFPKSDCWERYKRNTHTCIFDDLDMTTDYLGSQLKRITSDTPNIVNVKYVSALPMIKNIFVSSNFLPREIYSNHKLADAVAARFEFYEAIRHNGVDLLVTPMEKPNRLFPVSLINILNNKGFNLQGNPEPSIDELDVLGSSI
ncbi:Rep [uncultured virus]|uniref:Rep n=1 Tax=uncultured virus TaxID=340016 RepID=A0A2K9LWR9_9VIRU|nr:Rep [uncultured virus]